MKFRLPFDLPTEQYYSLEITPDVTAAMMRGDGLEKQAIELIAENWTNRADKAVAAGLSEPEFGLSIPHLWGFSATERKTLQNAGDIDRDQLTSILELTKRISEETGKSPEDITNAFMATKERGFNVALLDGNIDAFVEFQKLNKPSDFSEVAATLYVKRVIPQWTIALTNALHPAIRQSLTDFGYTESEGLIEKK